MDKKQINDKIRKEAVAKMNKYLKQGKDGGEVACPNWPEDHTAKLILLRNGKQVTICLECGYKDVG